MLRKDILIDEITQAKLDNDTLEELVASLWPQDCQTCGWSLGDEPCALVVNDMMVMAYARLHHPRCCEPNWNDSGLYQVAGGPLLSWVGNTFAMAVLDVNDQQVYIAGLVVNPSLEMVRLSHEEGRWKVDPLSNYRGLGYQSPQDEIFQTQNPLRDSLLVITPTSWRVSIPGALQTFELSPESIMTEYALKRKGVFVIVTQAVNPGQLQSETMEKVFESRHTLLGWVPLYDE